MKKEFIFTHEPISDEILSEIRNRIPLLIEGTRLNHTFFVEKEAITIAKSIFSVYNVSDRYLNDIIAAALLHDMTKQMDIEKQLELCDIYSIDKGAYPSGAILHGKTAAHMARELFGINEFVFSAIYNHTTGCENMGLFDKIIFIADYTEKSRTYEHCINTRKFLHEGLEKQDDSVLNTLNKAVLMSLDGTITHLVEKGSFIDTMTVSARNCILEEL